MVKKKKTLKRRRRASRTTSVRRFFERERERDFFETFSPLLLRETKRTHHPFVTTLCIVVGTKTMGTGGESGGKRRTRRRRRRRKSSSRVFCTTTTTTTTIFWVVVATFFFASSLTSSSKSFPKKASARLFDDDDDASLRRRRVLEPILTTTTTTGAPGPKSSSSSTWTQKTSRLREKEIEFPKETLQLLSEREEGGNGKTATPLSRAAGYFTLNRTTRDAHMFYMFFEHRGGGEGKEKDDTENNNKVPVVLWMTGGPGCSSELAAFTENGPFEVVENENAAEEDRYVLKETQYGWDTVGHLLYVDQPVNTGFSFTSDSSDEARDEETVSNDMFEFLQDFFLSRPELADNPLFITGESYAGHYVPAVAHRAFVASKKDEGSVNLNLKGFAIGNGLTDPEVQYAAYAKYSVGIGIVSAQQGDMVNAKYLETCEKKAKKCNNKSKRYSNATLSRKCVEAVEYCQNIPNDLLQIAAENKGGKPINVYDVRKECVGDLCYDFSPIGKFLNQKSTREALGVGNRKWETCNMEVHEKMMGDWMRDYEPFIPEMLENGVRGMIYAGESDFICNFAGNLDWTRRMEWSGGAEFAKKFSSPFVIDGEKGWTGGEVIQNDDKRFSFVKVSQAGHMVPLDQPKVAQEMLRRFVNDEDIATGGGSEV